MGVFQWRHVTTLKNIQTNLCNEQPMLSQPPPACTYRISIQSLAFPPLKYTIFHHLFTLVNFCLFSVLKKTSFFRVVPVMDKEDQYVNIFSHSIDCRVVASCRALFTIKVSASPSLWQVKKPGSFSCTSNALMNWSLFLVLRRNISQVVVRVISLVKTTSAAVTCEVLLLCSEDLIDNCWF